MPCTEGLVPPSHKILRTDSPRLKNSCSLPLRSQSARKSALHTSKLISRATGHLQSTSHPGSCAADRSYLLLTAGGHGNARVWTGIAPRCANPFNTFNSEIGHVRALIRLRHFAGL